MLRTLGFKALLKIGPRTILSPDVGKKNERAETFFFSFWGGGKITVTYAQNFALRRLPDLHHCACKKTAQINS